MSKKVLQLVDSVNTYHRSNAHGRTEEKLVELEAGVQGRFSSLLDFSIFDLEIDGPVYVERWRRQIFTLEVVVHFQCIIPDLGS